MNNYYITFGNDERFPYPNQYLKVLAESRKQANQMFRVFFPDWNPGILNYSFMYNENEWKQTNMKNTMSCAGNITKESEEFVFQSVNSR